MNVFSGSKTWAEAAEHMGMTIPEVQKAVSEGKATQTRGAPDKSLSKSRDTKGGWGKKFGTAQEALNDAIQNIDEKLWNAFNKELDSNTTNHPITNAINAVMHDVRQDKITPMQGAMLLSQTYEDGGVDALSKLYSHKTGNLFDNVLERAKQIGEGKASREMSPEDYNNFGWVRDNNIISAGYWKNFTENFAQAVTGLQEYPQSNSGEFMIAVYDVYDTNPITNVVVFAQGSIDSPIINRVAKVNFDDDIYYVNAKMEELYATEYEGVPSKAEGIFTFYNRTDFIGKFEYKRNSIQSNGYNNQLGIKRSRSEVKANPAIKFHFDEYNNTVTITYRNGEVITKPWEEKTGKASREIDTAYLDAVKSGDMETAQKMVDEAA